MRVTWEESDIKAGRRFGDPKSGQRGIVGFLPNERAQNRYVVISLNDGMVFTPQGMTKDETAKWLTKYEYLPEGLLENGR